MTAHFTRKQRLQRLGDLPGIPQQVSGMGRAAANTSTPGAWFFPLTHQGWECRKEGVADRDPEDPHFTAWAPLTSCFPSKLQPLVLPNPGRATPWTLGCCAVPGAWPPSPGSDPSEP